MGEYYETYATYGDFLNCLQELLNCSSIYNTWNTKQNCVAETWNRTLVGMVRYDECMSLARVLGEGLKIIAYIFNRVSSKSVPESLLNYGLVETKLKSFSCLGLSSIPSEVKI